MPTYCTAALSDLFELRRCSTLATGPRAYKPQKVDDATLYLSERGLRCSIRTEHGTVRLLDRIVCCLGPRNMLRITCSA